MNSKFFNKSKNILRRALAIMLCLFIVSQGYVQAHAEAVDDNYCSYEWTRIETEDELKQYYQEGQTDRDERSYFVNAKDTSLSNSTNWYKAIIAYEYEGRQYMFSGSNMVEGGEQFGAVRILPQYFYDKNGNIQHLGDKTLNSVSGLYTPYIKYAGTDGDNNNHLMFYLRFAGSEVVNNEIVETLGPNTLAANISWYGIAHASAAYGEFIKTPAASPSGYDHGAACDHNVQTAYTTEWAGGLFQAYVNVKGAVDRWWSYDDGGYNVELVKYPNYNRSKFYLYLGKPSTLSLIDESLVVETMTTTYNTAIVTEKAMIEIPKGACVVMDGLSKVNGSIVVNGGTLIIKGTMDTSQKLANTLSAEMTKALRPGSIRVSNGGCLYVMDTGVMCLRLATSQLIVEKGSSVRIEGSCVIAGTIDITDSNLYVAPGAALIHGVQVQELMTAQSLGKAGIAANRDKALDGYVSDAIIDANYKNAQGCLRINSKACFEVYGLYYRNPNGGIAVFGYDASIIFAQMHSNIHAYIKNMMYQW